MAIENNDLLKAVWQARQSNPNTISQNVFLWRIEDALDFGEANVGADIINYLISMYTEIDAALSDEYILESVRITNESKKEFVFQGTGAGFAGVNIVAQCMPAQNAVEILARSRKLGKPGRKYLGPVTEDVFTDGTLDPLAVALFDAFLAKYDNTFVGAVTTNAYRPGTATYFPGGAVNEFTPWVQGLGTVYRDARTQRRRRPRVGLS